MKVSSNMWAMVRTARCALLFLSFLVLSACRQQTPVSSPGQPQADGNQSVIKELSAGAAVRVITPVLPAPGKDDGPIVYMGGLERGQQPTGIHDDLYARALVVTGVNGRSVGLVV